MPKKNLEERPQALIVLKGKIVQHCMDVRKTTGVSITALVRSALLEWFQRHSGEPGVERINF